MNKKVLVMVSPFSAARVAGVARYAREHSWHLMIQDRLGHRPLAWNGDGIIATLRSDAQTVSTICQMMRHGIPVVDLTVCRPEIRVPRVVSDHVGIGRLAAKHFADRNFRNTVWFSMCWGNVHALRYAGFTETNHAERWVAEESLPKTRRNDWNVFMSWIAENLAIAPKPLAALAYDETDASRLLDAAERIGISVPEELAILSVGNDGIICENQSVPLSSIDQNLEEGGYEAAALLDRLMDGGKPPDKPVIVPAGGICLRRSTDVIASHDRDVRRALDYITGHISMPLGAAQIALALGMSRNTLDKKFKADLGRSIGSEIKRQRIAKVKLLLKTGCVSTVEIARQTGFCNASHMANAFRAATGLTPRAWRKAPAT